MPLLLIFLLLSAFHVNAQDHPVYIRMNQAGFLPEDLKTGIVFSKWPLTQDRFVITNISGKVVSTGALKNTSLLYNGFHYSKTFEFSDIKTAGQYRLKIKGAKEFRFKVDPSSFRAVRDSLMLFFKVQRCGPTDPELHEPCHLSDATRIPGYTDSIYDVTGGWHDAGDYIKFLSTAAYTTYMLIFAYEFDPVKFGFDNDENSVPDVLDEAKVGLDWLLRCRLRNDLLVTQVQDLRDHAVGWRLPEKDSLRFDRPGFTGIGKNIIGIYSAALSIGARIWDRKFYDYEFAARCLEAAEGVYSVYRDVPDIDKVQARVYQDTKFAGKLALGAVELYLTTRDEKYLQDAMLFADSARADYWWSFGDINSLADYRLAKLGKDYSGYIKENLLSFKNKMQTSLFGEGVSYTWGTTNSMLGATLQVILYKDIYENTDFDSLLIFQRDFVTGRNPWGLSFIQGIGFAYPGNLHSQIAYFKKGYLPGSLSAGPAPMEILKQYNIMRRPGKYDEFNTGMGSYFDDFADYITNEPTIIGNATALFVYGFFAE